MNEKQIKFSIFTNNYGLIYIYIYMYIYKENQYFSVLLLGI